VHQYVRRLSGRGHAAGTIDLAYLLTLRDALVTIDPAKLAPTRQPGQHEPWSIIRIGPPTRPHSLFDIICALPGEVVEFLADAGITADEIEEDISGTVLF
jgi:hypothetical protein